MKNLWNSAQAAHYKTDLEQRVYSSRLLGSDPSLVLHGGGNTSVKIQETNLLGEQEQVLYVKGSGWDLVSIEAAGYTPIRMDHLLRLATLESLSDSQMVNEMKTHQTIASAPTGSVEAILHAVLPYKFVDHTHADALVTITNTADGEARIRQVYGHQVVIIPYVMPGFDLARMVAQRFAQEAGPTTRGMILMNHGIFSFGKTAQQSYERMIDLVGRAEQYLQKQAAWDLPLAADQRTSVSNMTDIAKLRRRLSNAAGQPMILRTDDSAEMLQFCHRDDLSQISQQGPATPDHVIRTKRLPQLGRDLDAYVAAYQLYFDQHAARARTPVTMLDPAPRVLLDTEWGLLTAGESIKDANINRDIYRHTVEIIQRAELLGGWQALPAQDVFDIEYWELEQVKLKKRARKKRLHGEVTLVTGAASGIGKACVDSFLAQGSVVIGLDLNKHIEQLYERTDFIGISCDVTDRAAVTRALERLVMAFGGLDMLILNAGMFPAGSRIAELGDDQWHEVMSVNLDANLALMRVCYPLLRLAPKGGRVVVIGSKNVPAPGPGAAAYSASKAALIQLARVAALEWGADGIRINSLHPDAVFDTGLWTDEVLQCRADHYAMSVQAYKTKNILRTEVTSHDVAELAVAMCGPLFAKTTASQVPVDGGNDRVI